MQQTLENLERQRKNLMRSAILCALCMVFAPEDVAEPALTSTVLKRAAELADDGSMTAFGVRDGRFYAFVENQFLSTELKIKQKLSEEILSFNRLPQRDALLDMAASFLLL